MANLSKIRREKMLEYLEKLKAINNDDGHIRAITEIENALNEKKYGLVWEEHSEKVDEELIYSIPIFVEDEERKITANKDEPYNFLLEGDNLHSLKLLEKTHKGKIDVIYIDPPYNRGKNDFRYDDNYIGREDAFRHSKWASFMKKRIAKAYELLSDDGVFFTHIDDNEQAVLKLLCDEIFGENNFLGTIIQNKLNSKNDTAEIQRNHEFIHVYRKKELLDNDGKAIRLISKIEFQEKEVYKNDFGFYYLNDFITTRGEGGILVNRKNLGQTVYYNPKTGDFFPEHDYDMDKIMMSDEEDYVYKTNQEHIDKGYVAIRPPKVRGKLGVWTWEKNKMIRDKHLLQIVPVKRRGYSIKSRTYVPCEKVHESNGKYLYRGTFENNVKSVLEFSTNEGTNSLTDVMGVAGTFENPKNVDMMMYLLSRVKKANPLILDFFAGSGTTGHAVMQLNKEDGGNRKYILCTNNENNICEEVTYQRLKNIQNELPHNLKYFKTDFIPKFTDKEDSVSDKIMDHIRELIELEHALEIDGRKYIIISDEEQLDEVISEIKNCGKLFIKSGIFLTRNHQRLLEEKDVSIIEIPEYYFREELKEIGEL